LSRAYLSLALERIANDSNRLNFGQDVRIHAVFRCGQHACGEFVVLEKFTANLHEGVAIGFAPMMRFSQ
jgi:hypothetical protein